MEYVQPNPASQGRVAVVKGRIDKICEVGD